MQEMQRKRPQEIPASGIRPRRQVEIEPEIAICVRSAPSGSSPGPGGCSKESLLHFHAAAEVARADVPRSIFKACIAEA